MKQNEQILWHLNEYGSITPLTALREYGIFRLASRICELKKAGVEIEKEMKTALNRRGEPVHYARYRLKEEK